ncbi:MAG TPA: methyl-accepting chemotaxis protein [Gemmatimonadaceae bacterium]|jgi:methyl-accepting chemotaxis protein|nr:methyl-accepting chemotaxis protein [Gemmatimonadaceae bacterium]
MTRSSVVRVFRLSTIRDTLIVGLGALVLCLLVAGIIGWGAVRAGARDVSLELQSVLATSRATSDYTNIIAREIEAATSYLTEHDTASLADFRRFGREAHALQRQFNSSPGRTAGEIAGIAAVDSRLADFENSYALAHRLNDLGRTEAARAEAERGHRIVTSLLNDLSTFDEARTREVENVTNRLGSQAAWRATLVLAAVIIAVLLALMIARRTMRAIDRPLRVLTRHASRLSEGDLGVRTATNGLPGEFVTLAGAMNHTSESLSRVVDVVANTANDVTHLAEDLATSSREVSDTASQVSDAVTQVSVGAEAQVQQIQQVTRSLNSIRDSADGVAAGAEEVQALAGSIEAQARAKQNELEHSLAILYDVRTIVLQAVDEVRALNAAVGNINKFVVTVGRIADQTNLLSLNAAIEAARAGAAGRGFGVVADEIRKLADQARGAADDVVELTTSVTTRVLATSTTMEQGAKHVDEIERVSREINQALAAILTASEQTKTAADGVTRTADANVRAVQDATSSLSNVARTAEGHAATAMQVSAASEEQSAACEQMSSASVQLLRGSTQLLELVRELKTA